MSTRRAAAQPDATPNTLAWALAPLLSLAALGLTVITPFAPRPYLLPVGAVALAAWLGGLGPALATTAITLVGTNLLIARAQPLGAAQLAAATVYLAVSLLIAFSARAMARTARAASRQAAHLEAMFGQAAVGIAHLTLDGRLARVNQRLAAIADRAPADMVGLACEALCHPDDCPAIVAALAAIAGGDRAELSTELRGLRHDGSIAWLHVSLSPLLGEDGQPESLMAVVQDVTERHVAEEALRQADRQKDDFLALLSHELRNPLAPIRTAVHLLRQRHAPDADSQRLHAVIERQVGHLVRLVDDLLDVSRVLRGKIELRPEPLDLAEVVATAVETMRPAIDRHRQRLRVVLPDRPVFVHGDQVRLAQVLGNLLHNASKFTDREGAITLTVSAEEGRAVVRVEDTGAGIDATVLPHVFEPFVQADRSLERSRGGLGIGLTLVRKMIELHGGHVDAESAGPGQGSVFTVTLPAVEASGAATADAPPGGLVVAPPTGLRVLVVDDNVDAADSLATLLGLRGHAVSVAHDGHEALARALADRPDVVLLDIGLPGMNGYEVATVLRQQPGGGPVLVAVTGYGQGADARRAAEAGFDRHLVKPVDAAELDRVLTTLAC
ncbi:MAG: ATP-binding protein [Gemmatimonadales bacterium]|nr:ATP-binding protein [Gemmatimonadales bacterium]